MKTNTVWKKKLQFESRQGHQQIQLDGDREQGFSPKALLLSGLAGCSGVDMVDILKKMRVDFSGLEIEASAEQTEEHPRVFREIRIRYQVQTAAANEDKVRRAIELSLEKYCGVAAMLRRQAPIHYELVLT